MPENVLEFPCVSCALAKLSGPAVHHPVPGPSGRTEENHTTSTLTVGKKEITPESSGSFVLQLLPYWLLYVNDMEIASDQIRVWSNVLLSIADAQPLQVQPSYPFGP